MPSFETAARSLKVAPIMAPVHSDTEIETAIIALGREPGGGLVVLWGGFHLAPIISAAARYNVPAVYTLSEAARNGGLLHGRPPINVVVTRVSLIGTLVPTYEPLGFSKKFG